MLRVIVRKMLSESEADSDDSEESEGANAGSDSEGLVAGQDIEGQGATLDNDSGCWYLWSTFYHQGQVICRDTFLALHGIGKYNETIILNTDLFSNFTRYQALKEHYSKNGRVDRCHGNSKRLPSNALTFRDTENIKKFICQYAQIHSILLLPGYKRDDLQ